MSPLSTRVNNGVTKSPAFNANGQQTDDGVNSTSEWDAFGRLRKVKNRATSALVVEYVYNGLNMQIGRHADPHHLDADGDVDSTDKWEWTIFDPRWRRDVHGRGRLSCPSFVALIGSGGEIRDFTREHVQPRTIPGVDGSWHGCRPEVCIGGPEVCFGGPEVLCGEAWGCNFAPEVLSGGAKPSQEAPSFREKGAFSAQEAPSSHNYGAFSSQEVPSLHRKGASLAVGDARVLRDTTPSRHRGPPWPVFSGEQAGGGANGQMAKWPNEAGVAVGGGGGVRDGDGGWGWGFEEGCSLGDQVDALVQLSPAGGGRSAEFRGRGGL